MLVGRTVREQGSLVLGVALMKFGPFIYLCCVLNLRPPFRIRRGCGISVQAGDLFILT